ncbi:hypothetical protein KM043_017798 [Ampulex compressa]|nr:hypothetical protein KM043_017798 [Ampulex compressa]
MNNPGAEKWRPIAISNPSTRLRMARSMPHWVMAQQQQKQAEQQQRRPPTPPKVPPPSLSGDCGDPDYEIIEFPTRPSAQKASTPHTSIGKCALCGTDNVFARCDTCKENYCEACDDMNHKHPKRKGHVRRRILTDNGTRNRPPLPPKGENLANPPIPPPRRNRKTSQAKSPLSQGAQNRPFLEKAGSLKRNAPQTARQLSTTSDTSANVSKSVQALNASSIEGSGSGTDKMSTLQERYRKYQEAMRAQDANRRRPPSSEVSRDTLSPRPFSMGGPKAVPPLPPPPPPRAMMQSASVCDLSSPHAWNPGMHQAQSMAHLGAAGMPMMWYPPSSAWDMSMAGSTMSLNHPAMWGYPMGYPPAQMIPPLYPGTLSRAHSPARSLKSSRRSRPPSPSPSLKSRKSLASRSRSIRSPGSPSDASSENSDESDIDDRLSRGSRSTRRGSASRSVRQRSYHDDEGSRGLLPGNRRERLMSDERITSAEERWSESPTSKRYSAPTRDYVDVQKGTINSRRRYNADDRAMTKLEPRIERIQNAAYRDRRRRSTDGDSSDRRSDLQSRARVTSSSDDYLERMDSVAKQEDDELSSKRRSSIKRDSGLEDFGRSSARRDSRRSSFNSDQQGPVKTTTRDTTFRRSPGRSDRDSKRSAKNEESVAEHPSTRDPRNRIVQRGREITLERSSSLSREVSREEADRASGRRSSGRSSFESDNQSSRLSTTRDTIPRKSRESGAQEVSRSSSRNRDVDGKNTEEPIKREAEKLEERFKESRSQVTNEKAVVPNVQRSKPIENKHILEDDNKTRMTKKQAAEETTEIVIPKEEWACEHCTFINNINDRVCVVCCKTKASALPPEEVQADSNEVEMEKNGSVTASSNRSDPSPDLEKKAGLLKISNSEESGDSGSVKNKGLETSNRDSPDNRKYPVENVAAESTSATTDSSPLMATTAVENVSSPSVPSNSPPPLTEALTSPKMTKNSETRNETPALGESTRSHSVSTGTSPPPQNISTQTYDYLPGRALGGLGRSSSVSKGMLYYDDSDAEEQTRFENSPDLYPRASQEQYLQQLMTGHSRDRTRRNSIDSSHLYYRSREPSQPRFLDASPAAIPAGVSTLTRQGLEIVELLREAEKQGFSTDDMQVALAQGASNPIEWLRAQWPHLVETVQVLVFTQGKDMRDNDIGRLSAVEAKEALRSAKGDVWNAVTIAVQRRQQKCEEIMKKGTFTLGDVVKALENNGGVAEAALFELQKNQLKPFLMRIWGPPVGVENDEAAPREDAPGAVGGVARVPEQIPTVSDTEAKKQVMSPIVDHFVALQADFEKQVAALRELTDNWQLEKKPLNTPGPYKTSK